MRVGGFAALVVLSIASGCAEIADLDQFRPAPKEDAGGGAGFAGGAGSGGGTSGGGAGGGAGSTGQSYVESVNSDNPIGYWRLGESTGIVAFPERGTVEGQYWNGCVLEAPGAIAGDGDTAVEFTNDCHIQFGDEFDFSGSAHFSLEAWVKPTTIDTSLHRIFSKEQTDPAPHEGYDVALDGSAFSFDRWQAGQADSADTAQSLAQAGGWTHVVATFGESGLRIFVNGAPEAYGASLKAVQALSVPFVVGASSSQTNFFSGVLDEVAIYDYALPEERAAAHHAAGTTP